MFDNWYFGRKQNGMDGTAQVIGVINIERIDAHECGACFDQILGSISRQERMALEILVGSPVSIPTRADQHCFATKVMVDESGSINRSALRGVDRNDNPLQIRQALER